MEITVVDIGRILTRAGGFLKTVCSHSLQPYRGCTLGRSLCGAACYVQHARHLTRGRQWGGFLEVRRNAAESYLRHVAAERRWARRTRGRFAIFMSSATEPFLPQERRFAVSRSLLEVMLEEPPDTLILQSHSHRIADYLDLYPALAQRCELRCHLSIETDRDRLPGLPPHASPVAGRFAAALKLREAGVRTVVTVSPLLPIAEPDAFFARIARSADAVVVDHFIGGDGTADGRRTRATPVPRAMEDLHPGSSCLAYRDRMVQVAQRHLPGRVGVGPDGFAGRYLSEKV